MIFDATGHEYSKDGKRYVPVGEFLSRFKPVFPKGMLAEKISKRDNVPFEDVLEKWDLNAKMSTDYGNAVHDAIEYWVKFGETSKIGHLKDAVEKFAKLHDRATLLSERIVEDDTLLLAGTVDLIEKLGNKHVNILDIKTNGELTDKAKGYFLAPLNELPFSKINEYRLQLSAYKYILERKGLTVDNIKLEHFTGEWKTIELEPINIEILL